MIHPHYVFWLIAPGALTLTWYVLQRFSRVTYAVAVLLIAVAVVLSGMDFSQAPGRAGLEAGLIVAGSPFLGVLIVTMAGWGRLRKGYPWLALAIPVAYYLGFAAGVTIGMATGVIHP